VAETATHAPAKRPRPIIDFLVLPADPGERPYLAGSRCPRCAATYTGARAFCAKCSYQGALDAIRLSDHGEVYIWTIVHQSAPGIKAPYVAAIVDLPEGVSVRANIEEIEPKPENMRFGMKVQMYTEKVREDREGNDIIAYKFKPSGNA
jgi:uncharacterized OB-fold protein